MNPSPKTFLPNIAVAAFAIAAQTAFASRRPWSSVRIHVIRAESQTFENRGPRAHVPEATRPNEGMLFVFPQIENHCI